MTRHEGEQGFTLVEVLVALVILALAAGAFFQIMNGSTGALRQSLLARNALTLAQSTLAAVGHTIGVRPGHQAGSFHGQDWTVDIGDQLADLPPAMRLGAYPVRVTVHWQDARGRQFLVLDSVRLGPEQTPPP